MSTELGLYGVNLKLWQFIGLMNAKNYRKLLCLLIFPLTTIIFQLNYILNAGLHELDYVLNNHHEFSRLVLVIASVTTRFSCLMRIYTIAANKNKVDTILREIERMFNEARRLEKDRTLKIFENVTRKAKVFSSFTLIFGVLIALGVVFVALRGHKLPFDITVPGIDVMQSPFFEICFGVQLILVVPFLGATHPVYTNIVVAWLMFGIGLLKDLQQEIGNLSQRNGDGRNLKRDLKICLQYHKRIIRFIKLIEDLISVTSLVEFMLTKLILIALMASVAVTSGFAMRAPTLVAILGMIYSTIMVYWFANEVAVESVNVANEVYSIVLMRGGEKLKSSLIIMIARCQKPITIRSGGMIAINLLVYQQLIKTSYSFFALIRQIVEK